MGVFDNFGEYNAEEEAARRKALMEEFLALDETHLVMVDEQQKPTVKIEKTSACGTSYSATCPSCGKIIFLSKELNTMSAVCNRCYCVFKLEK